MEEVEEKKAKNLIDKLNDFLINLGRVSLKEKLFFVRNLGIMLKGGIPFSQAFKTLAKSTENKLFAKILTEISDNVDQGASLSDSLRKHRKIFGDFFINMIESGEISGKLEEVLSQLYLYMKKQHELMSKVKSALTYPVVIIIMMIGIGATMMIAVVPKITGIFKEYDTELPLVTKILITISDFTVDNGLVLGLVLIILVALAIKLLKTDKGLYAVQFVFLRLPVLSLIIKKINLARFARTVSSLLKTDVMIIQTFEITASVISNLHYRKLILEIAEKIKKGGQINVTMKDYPDFFPPVVTEMIMIGEQTGELDNILQDLAEFYEDEIDKTMEALPSLIEPLLILILGGGVGLLAAALIMPMYSLTSAV